MMNLPKFMILVDGKVVDSLGENTNIERGWSALNELGVSYRINAVVWAHKTNERRGVFSQRVDSSLYVHMSCDFGKI